VTDLVPAGVDREAILRHLNLDPNNVNTQALLLICQRYDLDPLMKHMVLISGKPYVTRDGYLHIAHATGKLDGVEVVDEGETPTEWWAKVAVHRKDMTHPFTYRGRYPKDGQQKKYGPEMAIKCAEVMAMRRAFDVTGVAAADEQWDDHIDPVALVDNTEQAHALAGRLAALPDDAQRKILDWFVPPVSEWPSVASEHLDRLEGVIAKAESQIVDGPASAADPSTAGPEPVVPPQQSGPATITTEVAQRLGARVDALPDELADACRNVLHADFGARWPNELTVDEVPEASSHITEFEQAVTQGRSPEGQALVERAKARAGK
jgi:hypothetical protein